MFESKNWYCSLMLLVTLCYSFVKTMMMKIVLSSVWTMEKSGTKRVEITAIDDKRQITAVFACSLAGSFLPIQLIYKETTARSLPKGSNFQKDRILHILLIIGQTPPPCWISLVVS